MLNVIIRNFTKLTLTLIMSLEYQLESSVYNQF